MTRKLKTGHCAADGFAQTCQVCSHVASRTRHQAWQSVCSIPTVCSYWNVCVQCQKSYCLHLFSLANL